MHSVGSISTSPGLLDRLAVVARDIKLSHTVFAMPFALLAAFLAAADQERLPSGVTIGLIVLCMILGRTLAMAINRWADADLDAINPRTAGRAIPQGRARRGFFLVVAGGCAAGFVLATAGFWLCNDNPWPVVLSPAVLAWLGAYSFTKRFTWLCHLFLGSALAISPLAAGVGVNPAWLGGPSPFLLATMVLCWVAGFDIIYALQDVQIDRKTGIYSMPAKLGVTRALWISRVLHLGAIGALIGLGVASEVLNAAFALGCLLVAALLAVEHTLVWRSHTNHIHLAFFTLNGVISLILGIVGIVDCVFAVLVPGAGIH